MKTKENLWSTEDGRLVPTGHRDAQLLKYVAGDEVPDKELQVDEKQAPEPQNKQAPKPQNKNR